LDQNGNTIIDTFVKPYNKIIDYVTFFSGITKEAVDSTNVRTHDVQQAFRRILPPDAIICGHSIEGDLRALRLSHP
jgi:RNA exonuclease 1